MKIENEIFSDSFRALSAEKLGISVLELCADEVVFKDGCQDYNKGQWQKSAEEE